MGNKDLYPAKHVLGCSFGKDSLATLLLALEHGEPLDEIVYLDQGLPVPPAQQLQREAVAEARKCLAVVMACEAKGHLWKEKADPENGISELTCRRCGTTEILRW